MWLKSKVTWMYRRALCRILRLEDFFSSWEAGNCRFKSSKHSFRCARRFFSSLLWTSRVPALKQDSIITVTLPPASPSQDNKPCNSHSLLVFLVIVRLVQWYVGGGAPVGDVLVVGGSAGRLGRRLVLRSDNRWGWRGRCCSVRQKPTRGRFLLCKPKNTWLGDWSVRSDR